MLYFFFTKQFRDLRTTWASMQSRSSTTATSNAAAAQLLRWERERLEQRQRKEREMREEEKSRGLIRHQQKAVETRGNGGFDGWERGQIEWVGGGWTGEE